MKTACIALLALSTAVAGGAFAATNSGIPLPGGLAGHTLNAVAYVAAPPGSHGSHLVRFMVQAYLGPRGRAMVRIWDQSRDAYTPVAERGWSLEGSTLCVGLTGNAPARLCADVHVWGPRIAGAGINPYVQINGDLQPGNTVGGPR